MPIISDGGRAVGASDALMDTIFAALARKVEQIDPHEARLMSALRDAEGAAADFAVLTSDARTASELRMLAGEANRLALILGSACAAALRKAETL